MLWASSLLLPPVHRANLKAAKELGFDPAWFGVDPEDHSRVTDAVSDFQLDWGMKEIDGWVGPVTIARMMVDRIADGLESAMVDKVPARPESVIIVDGRPVDIPWAHVVHLRHEDALPLKRFSKRKKTKPGAVVHWPVTYTVKRFVKVMLQRNLGSHFSIGPPIIDENGDVKVIIWQHGDPAFRGVHAVGSNDLIGIDITSPAVGKPKVIRKMAELGHAPRPILTDLRVQGWRPPPVIGLHVEQERAVAALFAALNASLGLVLETQGDWMSIRRLARKGLRKPAVYSHAHVDFKKSGKYDYVGCRMPVILEAAKDLVPQLEKAS